MVQEVEENPLTKERNQITVIALATPLRDGYSWKGNAYNKSTIMYPKVSTKKFKC